MVETLEPLVTEIPFLDLSTKEGILKYQTEQQEVISEGCNGCYSTGCYSSSGCIDCYSVD